MTEPLLPGETVIDVLATMILDHDDPLAVLELVKPILAPAYFDDLCDACEACPEHLCDQQICLDDEADCAVVARAKAEREARDG